jgi:putative restriction endonuclease
MIANTPDTLMRTAASDHVRRLCEVKDHLTAVDLKPGFTLPDERIPPIKRR